ncbi:vitellogenin [Salix suchowensis]|nr:vitellogenin [Salix suchowensis]
MLQLQVSVPAPGMDFDFNEARTSPFLSAPSTPKRFGDCTFSTPTSPSRVAEFYSYFDSLIDSNEERSGFSFHWDERRGTPESPRATANTNSEDDFAFDFCDELEKTSLSADELFDGGKIRPLKPSPRSHGEGFTQRSPLSSPRSPLQKGKRMIREAFSPRKEKDSDPFATAAENSRKKTENERGRQIEKASGLISSSNRRASRSQSLFRASEYPWEEEKQLEKITNQTAQNPKASVSSNSSSSSKSSSRKWRLGNFLLFRSASEGHAHDKDRLRKYSGLFRKREDGKETSFWSTDSSGSASSNRKGPVSAHELHYTANKAVSENLKKKTFLPYKQGFFGRLAFNPAAHALGNGFGTSSR